MDKLMPYLSRTYEYLRINPCCLVLTGLAFATVVLLALPVNDASYTVYYFGKEGTKHNYLIVFHRTDRPNRPTNSYYCSCNNDQTIPVARRWEGPFDVKTLTPLQSGPFRNCDLRPVVPNRDPCPEPPPRCWGDACN